MFWFFGVVVWELVLRSVVRFWVCGGLWVRCGEEVWGVVGMGVVFG